MATLKVIAGGKGRETKAMRAKQPFSNREAKQLLKDWKELHRPPIRPTKAWHAKKALLLPKMLRPTGMGELLPFGALCLDGC